MQTYDLTLRDLLIGGAPELLRQVAGVAEVRLAPLEVPVVGGGRLDLFGDIDGETALHTEIQADNDAAIDVRMLGYLWLSLRQRPKIKVKQLVLYVGRAPMAMPNRIDGPGIAFQFDLFDVRTLRADPLLASDHPADIIMAFFAATTDLKVRVRAVVRRLADRFADDPPRLKDALIRLTLLAPLRRAEVVLQEEVSTMPITIDLETHPFASKFFLKGRAEGRTELFLRLLRRRYPTLPPEIDARIRTANIDQLDLWSERLVDGVSLPEIFDDGSVT